VLREKKVKVPQIQWDLVFKKGLQNTDLKNTTKGEKMRTILGGGHIRKKKKMG